MSNVNEPDEGDPAILEALSDIAGIIEVVAAKHLDRIDELEAEVYRLEDRVAALKQQSARNAGLLVDLQFVATQGELTRAPDTATLARIRGLLHAR